MAGKSTPTKTIHALTDSEYAENYRGLFSSMSEGFGLHELVYDGNGNAIDYRFLDVNPAFEKLTGLTKQQVVGRTHNECLPQDNPIWLERFSEVVRSGVPEKFEAHSALDRYYQVFAYKYADHKFGVIFSDITEDKRASFHQEWLASFPENNPQPVIEIDANSQVIYQNQPAKQFCVACGKDDCSNSLLKDINPYLADLLNGCDQRKNRDIQIGKSWFRQSLLYLPEIQHLRIYTVEITDQIEAKQTLQLMNTQLEELVTARTEQLKMANRIAQQNIEERLAFEQSSAARERQQFETLVDLLPAYLVLLSPEREIVRANRYFREQFGDPVGMKCYKCLFNRDMPCDNCESFKPFENQESHHWEWEGPNGQIYDVHDFLYELDDTTMILEVGIDITKIKQAQKNLVRMNRYNRGLIEINMDALMTVKRSGEISDVNETAIAVTNLKRNELIGTGFLDLFTDREKAAKGFDIVFKEGSIRDFELELINRLGQITPVTFNAIVFRNEEGEFTEFFASLRDQTEFKRKEAELKKLNKDLEELIAEDLLMHDQLVQAEKLAALGRMLASITHEINNPLQTIKNSLYLLQVDTDPNDQNWEYLEIASAETKRISNLVAELREIYRPPTIPSGSVFNLVSVVGEVHGLIRSELDKGNVEWVVDSTASGNWDTSGNKDQIKQVLINLCINAIESMQPQGGQLELIFTQGSPDSKEIGVLVRDTGPGISTDYLDRLFEPFQTTKPKGGGLGLAISYEIVQRHKGRLTARNYEGGAEFGVWLPATSQ
ncbi:MAG TPA: PAS domain S-box protein [Anaerolineaceae bacterium]|nr:PAS domain S-box protein [Anaerolineaceae bacterium]